uniref:Exonuclease domain-containing protein n=1 Tax=viral metagenome TaxID=1070528 RepID=A0A6C0ELQ4_9ZZZZ
MLTRNQLKKHKGIRYIIYDFETSGLNPYNDDIIEIGAIDNYGNTFNVLLKTKKKLSNKITELTGITDNLLEKEGVEPIAGIKLFNDYINSGLSTKNNLYMIAHNNDAFDKLFLKFTFDKYRFKLPVLHFIDSYRMAQLILPELNYYSLKSLSKYFNIELEQDHRALSDCVMLKQVFNVLLTVFKQKYGTKELNTVAKKIRNPF